MSIPYLRPGFHLAVVPLEEHLQLRRPISYSWRISWRTRRFSDSWRFPCFFQSQPFLNRDNAISEVRESVLSRWAMVSRRETVPTWWRSRSRPMMRSRGARGPARRGRWCCRNGGLPRWQAEEHSACCKLSPDRLWRLQTPSCMGDQEAISDRHPASPSIPTTAGRTWCNWRDSWFLVAWSLVCWRFALGIHRRYIGISHPSSGFLGLDTMSQGWAWKRHQGSMPIASQSWYTPCRPKTFYGSFSWRPFPRPSPCRQSAYPFRRSAARIPWHLGLPWFWLWICGRIAVGSWVFCFYRFEPSHPMRRWPQVSFGDAELHLARTFCVPQMFEASKIYYWSQLTTWWLSHRVIRKPNMQSHWTNTDPWHRLHALSVVVVDPTISFQEYSRILQALIWVAKWRPAGHRKHSPGRDHLEQIARSWPFFGVLHGDHTGTEARLYKLRRSVQVNVWSSVARTLFRYLHQWCTKRSRDTPSCSGRNQETWSYFTRHATEFAGSILAFNFRKI